MLKGMQRASAFQLQFQVGKRSKLDEVFMLSGLSPVPLLRVVVAVTVNGQPKVLIDGVVTNSQYTPSPQGLSQLTVTGEDLTKVMDLQDLSGIPYPALPTFARVNAILAKYTPLGIIPKVIPGVGYVPMPTDRIPRQKGTDLSYIKFLADRSGYEFYHDPGPRPGVSFAYWGPTIKVGRPQPALTMNSDAASNVESLNFSYNNQESELPVAMIQEPFTKAPIPIPLLPLTPLNPPLGAAVPPPTRVRMINDSAKMSIAEATAMVMSQASKSANVVTANGSLNVLRYGRILQARKLVGVRGAGTAFNGDYYVESVTHKIKRGEYKQDFTLSRNALVSTRSRVRV